LRPSGRTPEFIPHSVAGLKNGSSKVQDLRGFFHLQKTKDWVIFKVEKFNIIIQEISL
jgi:hypothetical protein